MKTNRKTNSATNRTTGRWIKWLLPLLLVLAGFTASAQFNVNDTTKYVWYRFQYGTKHQRIQIDTVLRIPRDTFALQPKDSGALAYKGGLRLWNGTYWTEIEGGSGGVVDLSYDQANRTITPSGGGVAAILDLSDYVNPGLMSAYDKRRLDSSSYLLNQSTTGDSIFTIINDSTGKFHRMAAGTNMTIVNDGTKLTFHASGGSSGGSDSSYVTPLDFGGVLDSTVDNTAALQAWIAQAGYKRLYLPKGIWRTTGRLTIPRKGMYMYGDGPLNSIIKTSYINTAGGFLNNIDGTIYGDTSWTGATIHDIGIKHSGSSATKHINQALLVCTMGVLYDSNPSGYWETSDITLYNMYFSAPDVSLHAIKFFSFRSSKGGYLKRVRGDNLYGDRLGSNFLDIAGGQTGDHIETKWSDGHIFTRVKAYDLGRVGDYGFAATIEVAQNSIFDEWDIDGAKNIAMELIKTKNSQFSNSRIRNSKASTLAIAMNGFSTHLADENRLFNVVVTDTNSLGIQIQYQNYFKSWGNSFTNKDLIKIAGVVNSSFTGDVYDHRGTGSHTVLSIEGGSKNNIFTDITVRGDSATAGTFSSGIAFNGATTTGNLVQGASIRYGSGGGTPVSESAGATGNRVVNYSVNGTRYNFSKTYSEYARLLNIGGINLWFDGSNNLRRNSSLPASETDGTIIGGGGATLQQVLTAGDTTNKTYIFKHRPHLAGFIRKLEPNNVDSSYVYGGPSYQGGRFTETLVRIDGVNASGRPNYIWMFGYNQNGGGGRDNPNDASFHLALESHYESGGQPLFEWHMQLLTFTNQTQRLMSFTTSKATGDGLLYFTQGAIEFRNVVPNTDPVQVYANFGNDGMDLQQHEIGQTSNIRMYSNGATETFSILAGNSQVVMQTGGLNLDLVLTTSRNLTLSNRIKFNSAATPNGGYVTMDLASANTGKAFHFRNSSEESLLELTDGATFNTIATIGLLQLQAGTTAASSLRIPTGVAPSSPTEGDIYKDATDLYIYLNSAWVKLNDPYTNEITGSGAGTNGTLPVYTANYTLANSIAAQSGGIFTITGKLASTDQLYIGALSSDPGTTQNGAMYYNTSTGKMKVREAGAWVNVISSAGTAVVTSVGLSMPAGFTVSNTPITSSGVINVTTTLNGFLKGNGSDFTAVSSIVEGDLGLTDITTNNATTLRHGFLPKLSGSTSQFLRGDGTFATPAGAGDVSSAVAVTLSGRLVVMSGTTGKLITEATGTGYVYSSSGVGSFITSIPSADITDLVYTKVNNFPTARIAGRTTASTGAIEALTVDGTLTLASGNLGVNQSGLTLSNLGGAVATTQGGIPVGGTAGQILSKINSTNYNTQWVTPGVYVTDGDKGSITISATGTTYSIDAQAVLLSMIASQAHGTILANFSGSAASPSAVTATTLTANLDLATPAARGLVPPGGTSLQVLRTNVTATALEWVTPTGGGESTTANNGLTETGDNIQLGGNLIQNTALNGSFNLEFGLIAPLTNFAAASSATASVSAATVLSLLGQPKFSTATATDGNYTWTTATTDPGIVTLPTITANRTLTLPSNSDGIVLVIQNNNNTTFFWSYTGGTVKDLSGNTITNIANLAVTRLRADGTNWIIIGEEGAKGKVVLNADVINNNGTANTIADVTGLSFPVMSGVTYRFRFFIVYTAAATTTGSRWSINGPATTFLHYQSRNDLTTTAQTTTNGHSSYGLPAASNATSATTGSNIAMIEGTIRASANGTVIARFASEVASSAITAKALASYVEYEAIK